ncbi:MAG: methylenetetrahydrofolate--tRNA-(uracil(54)-C(5))-methyltransferase (FADH(2)-oxidizing) TrmFO [Clostridia bacterium]|nr:methylenetetrahydrofolate--tRNA-(uracil(54)-C(5))-methyltransferase (FADH(2)-oxidizing) TrmFO [Clostridia bacterium]
MKKTDGRGPVWVIGGGLAGSEAAWQLAEAGVPVRLLEMRPHTGTPAHHTAHLAELVCSNSLKADYLESASGLLKEELRRLGSLIMRIADRTRIPAGGALAVDRERFAAGVTAAVTGHPRIEVVRREVTAIPPGQPAVVATGPLTSPAFSQWLREILGRDYLYFYDAAAPVVTAESLDFPKIFAASRYGKGEADYLNCPLTEEEYEIFWESLRTAETSEAHLPEERRHFFEGCLPVEVLAARGRDTLRFGTMKPVGLVDPRTGRRPYAVVQLRPENQEKTLYNMVGFQTNLRRPEQRRVFRLIPGLEKAEFARYGMMHRNTFINSPELLLATLQLREDEDLFFAGQLTGVEGYVESTAAGLVAGINLARRWHGRQPVVFPAETAIGALLTHITTADPAHFQPMNFHFGLLPPLAGEKLPKKERKKALAERALTALAAFTGQIRA